MLARLAWFVSGAVVGYIVEPKIRKFIIENNLEQKLKNVNKARVDFTEEVIKTLQQEDHQNKRNLEMIVEVLTSLEALKKKAERKAREQDFDEKSSYCCGRPGDDCCI